MRGMRAGARRCSTLITRALTETRGILLLRNCVVRFVVCPSFACNYVENIRELSFVDALMQTINASCVSSVFTRCDATILD